MAPLWRHHWVKLEIPLLAYLPFIGFFEGANYGQNPGYPPCSHPRDSRIKFQMGGGGGGGGGVFGGVAHKGGFV
jgi:hypothetical protein